MNVLAARRSGAKPNAPKEVSMTHPEEKDEPETLDLDIEPDELSPTTLRSDRIYQKLVKSERPTVPPPAQSHIRDLLGVVLEEEEDGDVYGAASSG
jgi:hypothetical protein